MRVPPRPAPRAPPASGSASAASSAAASAAASPGGTSQPVSPCSTVSAAPPWAVAITGRPIACASIMTRPNASGSVEACTTTSASSRPPACRRNRRRMPHGGDAEPPRPRPLARGVAAIAGPIADQHADRVPPRQARHRLDQHTLALPARQPARQHHDRHAPSGSRHACASRSTRSGLTAPGSKRAVIDAARNHPHARRIDAVPPPRSGRRRSG